MKNKERIRMLSTMQLNKETLDDLNDLLYKVNASNKIPLKIGKDTLIRFYLSLFTIDQTINEIKKYLKNI